MIGASGAIAGMLGAYLILFPRSRIASLVPILFIFTIIEIPAFLFLIFLVRLATVFGLVLRSRAAAEAAALPGGHTLADLFLA